jgi:hypothetical protein
MAISPDGDDAFEVAGFSVELGAKPLVKGHKATVNVALVLALDRPPFYFPVP